MDRPVSELELDNPALRDAADVVARATADEDDAIQARDRVRRDGLPRLDADDAIRAELGPDEAVVAVRPSVALTRHCPGEPDRTATGRLYLTTARIVLASVPKVSIALADIDELAIAGERLLVTLCDGTGLSLETSRPRLLRVEVAASLAAARS